MVSILPRKGRPPANDSRRNAGISLTQSQIGMLDDAKSSVGMASRSEVVQVLIEEFLPVLTLKIKEQKNA